MESEIGGQWWKMHDGFTHKDLDDEAAQESRIEEWVYNTAHESQCSQAIYESSSNNLLVRTAADVVESQNRSQPTHEIATENKTTRSSTCLPGKKLSSLLFPDPAVPAAERNGKCVGKQTH